MESKYESVDLEQQLAVLLDDLSAAQDEMLELLSRKREHMATNDHRAMQALQPREAALCQQLEKCHARRGELLAAAEAEGRPSDSMGSLAATIDDAFLRENLGKQVAQGSDRMRLLQHNCLTNWVVAQKTMLHLSQMLEIIATGGQLQPTYGMGQSGNARGALVDKEA